MLNINDPCHLAMFTLEISKLDRALTRELEHRRILLKATNWHCSSDSKYIERKKNSTIVKKIQAKYVSCRGGSASIQKID